MKPRILVLGLDSDEDYLRTYAEAVRVFLRSDIPALAIGKGMRLPGHRGRRLNSGSSRNSGGSF